MTDAKTPPPAIPYAPRSNRRASRFALHYATFLATLFALNALVGGLLIFVVPPFKNIFKDFRTVLPGITQVVISIADFYDDNWGWAIALLLVLLVPLPLALLTNRVEPAARRNVLLLILVLMLIIACLVLVLIGALAIYLPHIKLIQAISGANP